MLRIINFIKISLKGETSTGAKLSRKRLQSLIYETVTPDICPLKTIIKRNMDTNLVSRIRIKIFTIAKRLFIISELICTCRYIASPKYYIIYWYQLRHEVSTTKVKRLTLRHVQLLQMH